MGRKIYFPLVVISLVYLFLMYFLGKNANKNVLGIAQTPIVKNEPDVVATLTPEVTPKPETRDSEEPEPKINISPTPKITQSPMPKSTPAPASEVNSFIERFSAQYAVDPNVLRHIAICESAFRSNAVNNGYAGLYQFGKITWENIRSEIGEDTNPDLRLSAEESVQTAAYALSKGKGRIWPNCVP